MSYFCNKSVVTLCCAPQKVLSPRIGLGTWATIFTLLVDICFEIAHDEHSTAIFKWERDLSKKVQIFHSGRPKRGSQAGHEFLRICGT